MKIRNEIEFKKDGDTTKVILSRVIEKEFRLEDFVINELPNNCYECPVGYMCIPGHPCGRNVPWTSVDGEKRPYSCKLRTFEEYIRETSKSENEEQ